jgi:N-acetylmuramoyl-L-alanine amidase
MKRTLIPVIALLVATLHGQTGAPGLLQVSAVHCWSLGEAARIVVNVSGTFDYHTERAHGPERLFFDIFYSRPRIEGHRIYSADVSDKLVKRVRVAETIPGVTRIVLDLAGGAQYTAHQLKNPDRLVIELHPGALADPPALAQPSLTRLAQPPAAVTPSPNPADPIPPAPVVKPAALPPSLRPDLGQAANLASDGSSSLTRALGLKIRRVVIDPGHGGHDQGTVGPTGLMEKDLVLDVALRLGKLIESRMGSEVIYTRSDDTFIPLEGRTAIANEKRADLFLSIHANSSPSSGVGGVETYYLNFTTSQDALAVAARENASSDKSVFELRDLIQKITLQDKAEESKDFANRIQTSLFAFDARYIPGIRNRGVKKAPFVVLIGASMPSVLAEIGFLSNRREESLLKRPEHRQRLAEALYRGVSRYAQSLSHFQVAQVSERVKN